VAITVESFVSPFPTSLVSMEATDQLLPPGETSSSSGFNMAVNYYNIYIYIYRVSGNSYYSIWELKVHIKTNKKYMNTNLKAGSFGKLRGTELWGAIAQRAVT